MYICWLSYLQKGWCKEGIGHTLIPAVQGPADCSASRVWVVHKKYTKFYNFVTSLNVDLFFTALYALSVVCPSHARIVPKRANQGLRGRGLYIVPGLLFL